MVMKPPYTLTVVLLLVQLQCMSCQKDDCRSYVSPAQPTATLIAKAGPDQVVTLPVNYSP